MTDRERAMILDYWRRRFAGDPDPLRGVIKRFRLPPEEYSDTFFIRLGVFDIDETTRH